MVYAAGVWSASGQGLLPFANAGTELFPAKPLSGCFSYMAWLPVLLLYAKGWKREMHYYEGGFI